MIWVLIGYMFLFIHRPFEVWPSLAEIHLERLYMVGALLYAATCMRWIPNRQHLAYFAFALAVLVCWFCSPWTWRLSIAPMMDGTECSALMRAAALLVANL